MEWPPHSGRQQQFPEIVHAAWFNISEAKEKIHREQVALLEELCTLLGPSR
jgi:predicted NUDIX family NTP pyrophosphohydrolase